MGLHRAAGLRGAGRVRAVAVCRAAEGPGAGAGAETRARLRGPELVTTAEFNARHEADGMAFVNEEAA